MGNPKLCSVCDAIIVGDDNNAGSIVFNTGSYAGLSSSTPFCGKCYKALEDNLPRIRDEVLHIIGKYAEWGDTCE